MTGTQEQLEGATTCLSVVHWRTTTFGGAAGNPAAESGVRTLHFCSGKCGRVSQWLRGRLIDLSGDVAIVLPKLS